MSGKATKFIMKTMKNGIGKLAARGKTLAKVKFQ